MIKLDLSGLSKEELEKAVAERCSVFGSVSQVTLMQDGRYPFAVAGVVMTELSEALALARNLDGTMLKNMVIIRLEQQ